MFDKNKIDLDAPAFGENAQKMDSITSDSSSDDSQSEERVEVKEEQKVPYSRFKMVQQRAIEAEREANEARERYNQFLERQEQTVRNQNNNSTPDKDWIEMFGDSEASKRAFQIDLKRREDLEERAMQRALEAVENREIREIQQTEDNVNTIDERLEDLSAIVGRDLTKREEEALLEIVDDYTPKDNRGNYAGDLIPFDKAWEIYELKNASVSASTRKSRDSVSGISSARSEGDTSISGRNVRPLSWSSYQDRLRN